ncbi:hypothetical protein LSM04_008253 [Trypanosoma melophagium]|uniref:uncharacterized protein n=1 Tax=Trypanosoma melophagium TaxID=715481 RepID=UPI00351A6507|nr:hypothetical protein LSM04_008253 [Trypanosoma melophagium]
MNLVEYEVKEISCQSLLAPEGWTLREYHDVSQGLSINVAHFERLDASGDSLYIAEHFFPRTAATRDVSSLQERLQQQLLASSSSSSSSLVLSSCQLQDDHTPMCVVWEVERRDEEEAAARFPQAALLDHSVLLMAVVLCVAEKGHSVNVTQTFERIVQFVKDRYTVCSTEEATVDQTPYVAAAEGVYTSRGCCVVELAQNVVINTTTTTTATTTTATTTATTTTTTSTTVWNPQLCKDDDGEWLQTIVAKELHLAMEGLCVTGQRGIPMAIGLLPLKPIVCLGGCSAMEQEWEKHVQSSGWKCVKLMHEQTLNFDALEASLLLSSSVCVTPRRSLYYLSKGNDEKREGVIACVTAPRVGSDCCTVLLTPASSASAKEKEKEEEKKEYAIVSTVTTMMDSIKDMHVYQSQCEWLLSAFRVSIATTNFWSKLGVSRKSGFLYRQGHLVVLVPSSLDKYMNVIVTPAVAFSYITLGSVIVTAEDTIQALSREVTIVLQKDFRSAEDYVNYIIEEHMYDVPIDRKTAIFRKQKIQQEVSSSLKQKLIKREVHSLWIRLGDYGAVYYVVRECGVGRLLVIHTCVLGNIINDTSAENWEKWVSGISAAAID